MTFLCYKQKSRVGAKTRSLLPKNPQSSSTRRDVRFDEMLQRHLLPKATHAGKETTLRVGEQKPLCTVKQENDLESILDIMQST